MKSIKIRISRFQEKLDLLPKIPKPLKTSAWFLGKTIMVLLNAIFIILCLYAITLSIGVTYAGYKTYEYLNEIYEEVAQYKDENPVESNFMKAMRDSSSDTSLVIHHKFVPLDSMSKPLINAVLAAEDAGFYLHPGIDLAAVAAAIQTNKARGKNVFGGSTITQQLAKNLFLSSERSWERKAKELAYAFLMEKLYGKDRILELYMNYAQWGKNIFGIGAACEVYYKRSPIQIGYDQSIRLASVLAKPSRYTPYSNKSLFLAKRRRVIVENLYLSRKVNEEFVGMFRPDTSTLVNGQIHTPGAPAPVAADSTKTEAATPATTEAASPE